MRELYFFDSMQIKNTTFQLMLQHFAKIAAKFAQEKHLIKELRQFFYQMLLLSIWVIHRIIQQNDSQIKEDGRDGRSKF